MKSEKGIARDLDKKVGNRWEHQHSHHLALLILTASNREQEIQKIKDGISRRTFRRVMSYVRAHERRQDSIPRITSIEIMEARSLDV